ncbi:TapB family protein [Carboxylicivirga sp. RSCT41]|uniref:TapB family protein n=1 Tax=Carboxylicivirga agarovorans TaxID=3417570 RepID=UPI003D353C4B
MKKLVCSIIIALPFLTANGQDCKAYIPYEEGTVTEIRNYDKKGKTVGVVTQTVTAVEHKGNNTTFSVHQVYEDPKSKDEIVETDISFKCVDGTFYIDMSGYLDQKQMEAYEGMEVKLLMDEINIPSSYEVGDKLKDGYIRMEITGGPMPMNMTVSIENRKVLAEEKVTTEAGTFDCIKISQDIVTKAFVNMTINSVEWYAEGVGVVRSETHRKGKMVGYSELTKFEKP